MDNLKAVFVRSVSSVGVAISGVPGSAPVLRAVARETNLVCAAVSAAVCGGDEIGGLGADQDARCVGVPADDGRHHRRVGDA